MKNVTTLGIDLAKNSFSVCGLTESGEVDFETAMKRSTLIAFTSKMKPCLIGMEACGGSHYWGRVFTSQGHRVKMMSVYAVKPFAPPQKKNDASDAKAIAVAARQATVPSVHVKSRASQDLDCLANLRTQTVKQRVAVINQAHAVCLEYGVALPKSTTRKSLHRYFDVLEDAANDLTEVARQVISELLSEANRLEEKADALEKRIAMLASKNRKFDLLKTIPGVGSVIAAAFIAHVGDHIAEFKNGRQLAAYIGLVPRQYSTGGVSRLGRITKSGNENLRQLIVIGARTALMRAGTKNDKVSKWAHNLKLKKGFMRANVAFANKLTRIIYAVMKYEVPYQAVA